MHDDKFCLIALVNRYPGDLVFIYICLITQA